MNILAGLPKAAKAEDKQESGDDIMEDLLEEMIQAPKGERKDLFRAAIKLASSEAKET